MTLKTHDLRLYAWMSRFGALNYRAKIMVMAFLGTHVPLIALVSYFALQNAPDWTHALMTIGVALVATLAGTGATLYVLNQLLRPVVMTSQALRAYSQSRTVLPLPAHYRDEVGTLMADAAGTIAHLETTLDALEHVDESTGLPNRKRFVEWVQARIDRREHFAVAVLRFTNHVRIAQTLDLKSADAAARLLAQRFGTQAALANQLARISASEFACVVGARWQDSGSWVEVAARLRAALDATSGELSVQSLDIKPILRGGMATHPDDGASAEALIDLATAAAAQAQDAAPVFMHSTTSRQAAIERFRIEQELRRAIERNEFKLHYQPVVDLAAGRAIGAEALIRWQHPERGMVPPGAFIAAAESSGLIEPIGLWVLRHACAQIRDWNDRGRTDMRVAINLSARQFLDPELTRHVLEAIDAHGIRADQLEIELTETAAMVDAEHTKRIFTSLRDIGVGIAIDDFGTGYASMSYLRKLPFDKLKIDREFVTDVDAQRHSQAICGALIELSRGLGLKVLAEGAETEAEVRHLSDRGCNLFQGYYFARPLPAPEFEQALDTPSRFILPARLQPAPQLAHAG